ncbi:unnamed protein product, partial [Brenthis ino]
MSSALHVLLDESTEAFAARPEEPVQRLYLPERRVRLAGLRLVAASGYVTCANRSPAFVTRLSTTFLRVCRP